MSWKSSRLSAARACGSPTAPIVEPAVVAANSLGPTQKVKHAAPRDLSMQFAIREPGLVQPPQICFPRVISFLTLSQVFCNALNCVTTTQPLGDSNAKDHPNFRVSDRSPIDNCCSTGIRDHCLTLDHRSTGWRPGSRRKSMHWRLVRRSLLHVLPVRRSRGRRIVRLPLLHTLTQTWCGPASTRVDAPRRACFTWPSAPSFTARCSTTYSAGASARLTSCSISSLMARISRFLVGR